MQIVRHSKLLCSAVRAIQSRLQYFHSRLLVDNGTVRLRIDVRVE